MSKDAFRISQAKQGRRTFTPPAAPLIIPFGATLQGKVSRNLSEAEQRESVSKQGSWLSLCPKLSHSTNRRSYWNEFRKRYGVECVSALHHNKRKTNYHIHLIFSERTLLPEADIKIASRSIYYDETGKRVRTKKEITGENGKIRQGCTVIKKGEVYESHLFSVKDDRYKSEVFLEGEKEFYTALINSRISDPEQHLKVFDNNSVYLPTKKIGKNNPKEAEIKADNEARQEWNRTADMDLVTGIAEAKIMEIKQTEIQDKASESIRTSGWLPDMFRISSARRKIFCKRLSVNRICRRSLRSISI